MGVKNMNDDEFNEVCHSDALSLSTLQRKKYLYKTYILILRKSFNPYALCCHDS